MRARTHQGVGRRPFLTEWNRAPRRGPSVRASTHPTFLQPTAFSLQPRFPMSDFRFANPIWIHAAWPVAVLVAALFWFEVRRVDVLSKLLSAEITVVTPSSLRR